MPHHTKSPYNAEARRLANAKYTVGDRGIKWRTGLSGCRCNSVGAFKQSRTPWFTRSRERRQRLATSSPGNKRKFLSDKKADVALTRRKWQHDVGQFEAITYFVHMKEETLTWAEALFHDGKVDSYGDNANVMDE
jgi:hypothetical protein